MQASGQIYVTAALSQGQYRRYPSHWRFCMPQESIWTLWRRATSLRFVNNWITILQMPALTLMILYRLSHSRLHSNLEFIHGLQYLNEEDSVQFMEKLFTVWKYWFQNFVVISFFCVFIACGWIKHAVCNPDSRASMVSYLICCCTELYIES